MLTSKEAWELVSERAPRGEWMALTAIYDIVERGAQLDAEDRMPLTDRNRSPRWKRTVRNALQKQKTAHAIEWDGSGRYRLA
jgi:hypothetical protein